MLKKMTSKKIMFLLSYVQLNFKEFEINKSTVFLSLFVFSSKRNLKNTTIFKLLVKSLNYCGLSDKVDSLTQFFMLVLIGGLFIYTYNIFCLEAFVFHILFHITIRQTEFKVMD